MGGGVSLPIRVSQITDYSSGLGGNLLLRLTGPQGPPSLPAPMILPGTASSAASAASAVAVIVSSPHAPRGS